MNPLASPTWQGALLLFAGALVLWEMWRGWRRGAVRALIHFSAFVLSGILGLMAGQATGFVVDKVFPGNGVLAGALVGSFVTLLILALVLFLGAVLFKRTAQQPSGMLRLIYGGGGAFFGLLTALVLLWGGITIIRTFGAAARMSLGGRPESSASPVAKALLTLQESLELGGPGKAAKAVDVVPQEVYDMVERIGKLTADRDAMMRFFDSPGMQDLMQNPKIAALLNDPSVVRAAEEKNLPALLGHPSLIAAAGDPALQKQLAGFDLQKALDYALPVPQSSPPHKKKP